MKHQELGECLNRAQKLACISLKYILNDFVGNQKAKTTEG